MKLQIITEEKNDLLGRKDLTCKVEFEGATPKKTDIQKEIANTTKSQEDLVVVKVIKNNYGEEVANVFAYIYDSIEDLKKLEEYVEPAKEEPTEEAKEETEEAKDQAEEKPAEEEKKE